MNIIVRRVRATITTTTAHAVDAHNKNHGEDRERDEHISKAKTEHTILQKIIPSMLLKRQIPSFLYFL